MANPDMTPDFIELETDNFVSPDAANDASQDDFIPLEIDPPAMEATEQTPAMETPPVAAESTEAPANPLGVETSVVTGNASGSLATGTMRGVGFSTAEGYVTALANGVKQATADSYKATLQSRYGFTADQIAALIVTIIPEGDLPVSQNPTVVTHDGPDVFAQRRMAQGLQPNARLVPSAISRAAVTQPVAETAPTIVAAIKPGTLIANLLKDGKGKIFLIGRSDRRATHRKRSEVLACLASVDRPDLAPRIKTGKAQFGEVMRSLNAPGARMKAWNVTRADLKRKGEEWPEGLASRWCVGLLDGSDALGSLGEKVLIADLMETNEIRFYGGNDTLHQKVSDAFTARVGDEMYNATDLLNWCRRMMAENFYTVEMSGAIFVPGNDDATRNVCGMIAALRPVLSRSVTTIDAVTGQGLFDGLAQGLLDEIEEIEEAFALAQDLAVKRDRAKCLKANPQATDADLDLAGRRAVVLPEAAGSLVRRLNDKADRVKGYETMLGTDAVAPVHALIAHLRATIEPLCDATSAMAANIELD